MRNFVPGMVLLLFPYLQKQRQNRAIFRRRKMLLHQKLAKKSLPSPDKIKGTLAYSGQIGDIRMENEAAIYLIPELLIYAKDFEQEYENCLRIIYRVFYHWYFDEED